MMATVLFAWELGAGLGHCVKLAPLAEGLVARGYKVVFAARDVVTARRVFQISDVVYLQAPCLLAKPAHVVQHPRNFAQVLHNVGFGDDEQLQSVVDAWRNLLHMVQPAVVVCEHAPSALLACRWIEAQRVVIGTGFTLPPNESPLPDLQPLAPSPKTDLVQQEANILDRVNRLLNADRLTPLERLSQLYWEVQANFLMTFPELDHHPRQAPAEYWGTWSPTGGVTPEWPPGEGPCVFAYLKPPPGRARLLESTLLLLRELPLRTIAFIPGADRAMAKLQTPSLRIGLQRMDIRSLLPECDVAILNGTAGTATQCLLSGVPLLMVPLYLEQTVFSIRVAQLGAALMAEPNRFELFAARLWTILQNDRYCTAAQAFAQRHEYYNAAQKQLEMIDRVEHCLTRPANKSL